MIKKSKKGVYIPSGAKINIEPSCSEPPKTKYERTMAKFDVNLVKKIVKGKYGNDRLSISD